MGTSKKKEINKNWEKKKKRKQKWNEVLNGKKKI